jgi:hypothetical protein
MRKLGIAKRVGAVLLSLLAAWSMVAAASGTVITSVSAQSTSSGPSTWHVLIGGQSQDQALQIALSGLRPGSVHDVQILLGVCGAPAPTNGILFSSIFVPPTFTLSPVTAGPDGRGTSTTILTQPPNVNGPAQLRIPSASWFINVAAGATPDNGAT